MSLLKQLPENERPRERLLRSGSHALTDAELLAVLLRTGRRGQSALEMAEELLDQRGGLIGLLASTRDSIQRPGLRQAKLSTLLAALELGRRLARARMAQRDLLDHPAAVASYLNLRYGSVDQEVMGALFLDIRNHLISDRELFRGTLGKALVEPRAILKEALLTSASGFILFHTHPSGNPAPSAEDLDFTERLAGAAELVGVKLLDHMILGNYGAWVSLKRRGAC